METDINFLTFIENHEKYFKKYDNLDTVERTAICGWLYIFTAYCYDGDITKVLPEFTDKFGKTLKELFERLIQYKDEVNIKNIEAIQCTLPCERERLIKAFLKMRTPIKPTVGNEYFINCRNLIKILMLIIVYISDEEIIKYETSYSNYKKNKNDTEFTILFYRIDKYINKIKENDEFELKIEENIYTIIPDNKEEKEYICEYCNKSYSNISNLNYHKKTAKFCMDIQKKNEPEKTEFVILQCEYCNKEFNKKSTLLSHLLTCKVKEYKDKIDKECIELRIKVETKDEQLKSKDKQIKKLEEKVEKLEEKVEKYYLQLFDNNIKMLNL